MRLAVAAVVGLAAGLEREWSGHASGPNARFAGIRTFCLLGLIGGIGGALAPDFSGVAAALLLCGGAICAVAYGFAARFAGTSGDGTTEVAALAVLGLGVMAGLGWLGLAAGGGAIVVLVLQEKEQLHAFVRKLAEPELHAGVVFAVLAAVVLPLLPTGPFFSPLDIRPRALWTVVLLFSAISFAGFVARRVVGASRGLGFAGALGGIVSSTMVTLSYSRQSRRDPRMSGPLALGTMAACTVLVPRVIVLSAVLNPQVAIDLSLVLAPMFLVGCAILATGWRNEYAREHEDVADGSSPLRLGAAVKMTIAFQGALLLIAFAQRYTGTRGLYASAALLGLTDVDALTVSMTSATAAVVASTAARAIAIGIIANTVLKLGVAGVLGDAYYRRRVGIGLGAMGVAGVIGLLIR